LHVTTERNRGDHVLGAVLAAARPQRWPEADRKAQYPDPAAPRDPVVAEFVEGDQHPQADDQPPERTDELSHGACPDWKRRRSLQAVSGKSLSRMLPRLLVGVVQL